MDLHRHTDPTRECERVVTVSQRGAVTLRVVVAPQLTIRADGDELVVAWRGALDAHGAALLLDAVAAALEAADGAQRIQIDLTAVDACTAEGIAALADCSSLGAQLVGGLRFRVGAA